MENFRYLTCENNVNLCIYRNLSEICEQRNLTCAVCEHCISCHVLGIGFFTNSNHKCNTQSKCEFCENVALAKRKMSFHSLNLSPFLFSAKLSLCTIKHNLTFCFVF